MALNLNQIRAIQHSIGSPNETETRRRYARHNIERNYFRSLDVDKFLMFDKGLTDTIYSLNTYDRKYSHYNGVEQKFTCPMEANVEAGDLVYNVKQDEYWVVITSNPVDYLFRTGTMFLCDTMIKWKDKDGNIWEYPVSDNNATQYNSGIFQGKMVDYVTSQHKLITTADINVCSLRIDTRFFLGKSLTVPEVFKLTQIDTSSLGYGKGIATLTVLRGTYNPETDDVTTGICEFKEDVTHVPVVHSGNTNIAYRGKPQIYIGDIKTVTADSDPVTWNILEPDIAQVVNVDATGTDRAVINIPVTDDALRYAGRTFTLVCEDSIGAKSTEAFTILGGA